ncbi:hypothetical protein L2E82_19990 [Cichorium intybus]|uniref:Uncharacterized protein n=1 Tax=Cichorium intybus TaxID=13427 RepID=A0ACB9DSI5_CICIN|nr:hypothetical protein L2E82_19990 [Cichorium intybus]
MGCWYSPLQLPQFSRFWEKGLFEPRTFAVELLEGLSLFSSTIRPLRSKNASEIGVLTFCVNGSQSANLLQCMIELEDCGLADHKSHCFSDSESIRPRFLLPYKNTGEIMGWGYTISVPHFAVRIALTFQRVLFLPAEQRGAPEVFNRIEVQ